MKKRTHGTTGSRDSPNRLMTNGKLKKKKPLVSSIPTRLAPDSPRVVSLWYLQRPRTQ